MTLPEHLRSAADSLSRQGLEVYLNIGGPATTQKISEVVATAPGVPASYLALLKELNGFELHFNRPNPQDPYVFRLFDVDSALRLHADNQLYEFLRPFFGVAYLTD